MGVHGLWQLLQPSGRPVSLESLEGKVLAVDVSIWLHQTMKGMRDKDGNPLPNAHLQGLFSRVCKLLFYRIKPVFVFDGGVPVLKKQTMAARRERKAEAERESTDIAQKLLQNLIKSQAVKQAIGNGSTGGPPTRVPGVRKRKGQQDSDMFELQPLPETEEVDLTLNASEWDRDFEMQENWIREGLAALSDTNPDSEEFKSLPMEIQHEILNELREQRKYHSLSRLTKMPEDSDDFSSYQLKKLMKQSRLSTRIDKVRKEMLNKTAEDITYSMGDDYYGDEVEARRIVSEDASHYVLIKGMTKRKQEEEAEKYELQKRVKLEKEEEDDSEYGGGNQSEGKSENTSPGANEKEQSSNVYSDSDSDVETVMSRRFRKKKYERRWNAEGVAMKLKEGKNKSTTGGKQVSSKNAAACQKEAEVVRAAKPSPIDESSSEDEGFIEVTVDPSATIEEDDLFPASIFETNVEPNNEEMVDSVLNEEKSGKSEQKSGKVVNGSEVPPKPSKIHAKVNKKERSKETTKDAPAPAISKADDEAAAKRRSVLTDILSQLQRKKQDLTEPLPEVENEEAGMSEPEGEDQVAESDVHVSVSSDQQENEEDFSMSGGFFRDDTSDDDDENLQVKEAVGKESIPSASINDTATDKTSDDNKNFHDQQAGRKESIASPTMKHLGASEPREKTDTVSHPGKKYESSEAANIDDMETLSDSDEDLKLAIQLSLQTAESEGVIDTGTQELSSKSGDCKVVNGAENNDDSHHRGSKMPALSEKAAPTVQGKHIVKSKKTAVPQVVSSESDDNENDNEDDGSDFEEVTPALLSSQSSDVISDDKSLHESIDDVEFLQETMKETAKQNRKNQRNNEISDGSDGSDGEAKAVSVRKDEEKGDGKSAVDEIPQDRLQPEDFEMDEDVATYFRTLNEDDLMDINSELDSERSALLSERGRQTRMATSVTEQINLEAQELLQLFGIPFIVSPMEAEAQCAFLDITDQTQGTITDDSDIWLFGGRRMYKNFFNQNKHVEFFTFDGIHNHLGLGREQLINIALLCGSDYTEGIQGVGPVRALEIMAEFPGEGLQGLYMFRKWWDKAKKQKMFVPESKARARLKDLTVIPGFPSEAVVDAYLNPTVDDSLEKFSWSLPDLDMLRDFAKHKFGWSKEKSDQSLVPMMKQLNKKESQGRIYAYFQPENFIQASKIKSDRLKKALELVRNPRQATEQSSENIDEDENVSSSRGNKKTPVKKAKKKKPKKQTEEDVEENDDDGDDISDEEKKVKKKKKVRFASTAVSGIEEETAESGKKKTGKGGKSSMNEERITDVGSSSVVNEESKDTEVAEVCGMNENKPVGSIRQSKGEMGEGFMQAMAEKVKQATKKLEEMKGKGRGRGRGEKQNVRGRGRVMISLDQKQRPKRGQKLTVTRGGGPRGRGAINLSESSSDSGDDEDDAPDYKGETGSGAVKSKNVRQQTHQPEEDMLSKVSVSKPKPPKPAMQKKSGTTSKPEQKKPVKTSANSSRASHTKNADPLGEDEGLKRKQSSVDCESQAAKETREIKVVKSRAERLQDAGGNFEKKAEQVSPEEHLVDKNIRNNPCREKKNSAKKNHESVKERTQTQPKTAEKVKTRPHAISSGQKNVPVEDQSPSIRDKTKSRMRKDESNGELRAETGTQLENNTNLENETQETNASNTEEQTEEIDIRKADVSIINKQNLPATLTYLNQRSKEDKFLLHQLTGRKMQNAVEKRLEESERRSKLETKEATKPTVTKPVEENLSFEDMLGGMDVVVTEKVQKKSKKAQAERKKSTEGEDSGAASDQALALRNRIAKQIGQVNTVLAGAETKDRSNKRSRDTRARTGDDEAGSEQPVTYGKVGEKVKLPKGGTVSFKSAETSQKDEEKVGFGSSDENMDWIDSGPVTKKNSQPSKEKDSLKSRRSAAFDKPIGSDDYSDSKSAKKSKFQKQLEHLDDGRSVRGLGYVPYQSESTGSAVRGRAFAGKGKGRGKNRNRGEDTGSNEWVKTMQPNAPDIRASRDVTEDEIMEYADMNADDLGSDFSDFEM